MKFDNGFSLRDFFIILGVWLFFFILACCYIDDMYYDSEETNVFGEEQQTVGEDDEDALVIEQGPIDFDYYYEKESLFKGAVNDYLNDIDYDITNHIFTIKIKELANMGYMDMIYDSIDNSICDGYANVVGEGNDYEIGVFIVCRNYISEGYYGG